MHVQLHDYSSLKERERAFIVLDFSAEKILISASAIPKRGELLEGLLTGVSHRTYWISRHRQQEAGVNSFYQTY